MLKEQFPLYSRFNVITNITAFFGVLLLLLWILLNIFPTKYNGRSSYIRHKEQYLLVSFLTFFLSSLLPLLSIFILKKQTTWQQQQLKDLN